MRVSLQRTRRAARAAFALCLVLAHAQARGQEWSRFEWVRAKYSWKTYERAALFLPVRLEGVEGTYYMQLDTGLNVTLLYEVPYVQVLREKAGRAVERLDAGPTPKGYARVRFRGQVGGVELTDAALLMRENYGVRIGPKFPYPEIGSVGLDLFMERPLILDFRNRRFLILEKGAALPPDVERRASFFNVEVRNGKLFVPVTHGGESLGSIFYDTGSSEFNVVTRALWQRLTGRTGDEPDNVRVTALSWGKEVTSVGAKTREPLRVGSLDVGRQMVYFRLSGAENTAFEKWPFRVDGSIGNAPFYDEHTVVLDLPRRRMGVFR